jgi:hypothetical protein
MPAGSLCLKAPFDEKAGSLTYLLIISMPIALPVW